MEIEKKFAALEKQIQELQLEIMHHQLEKGKFLDAITIEMQRLQALNENSENACDTRENAKCIADLGRVFVSIMRACN